MTMPNFPDSPTTGQTFTTAGVTYEFDGTVWFRQGSPADLVPTVEALVAQAQAAAATATSQASAAQSHAEDAAESAQDAADIVAGIGGGAGLVPSIDGVAVGSLLTVVGGPAYAWATPPAGVGPLKLGDLVDVDAAVPSVGDIMRWDDASALWKPVQLWPAGPVGGKFLMWDSGIPDVSWADTPRELPAITPADQGKVVGVGVDNTYNLLQQTGGTTYNTRVLINASRTLTPQDLAFDSDIEVDSSGGAINLTVPANLFALAGDATRRRGVGIYKVSNDANAVNLVPQSGNGPPAALPIQLGHDVSGAPLVYKASSAAVVTTGPLFDAALPTQNIIAPAGNDRILITWCFIHVITGAAYFVARTTGLTIDGAAVTPLFAFNQGESGSRYVVAAFGYKVLGNSGVPTNHPVIWSTNAGARTSQFIVSDVWKDVWQATPIADSLRDPDPTFMGNKAAGETTPTRRFTITSTRNFSYIVSMMAVHFNTALVAAEGATEYVPIQSTDDVTASARNMRLAGRKSAKSAPASSEQILRRNDTASANVERGNWIGFSLQGVPTSLIGTVIRTDNNAAAQLSRPYQGGLLRASSDGTTYYFYAR